MLYVDLARLFVGTGLLAFASYTDWRWRRAPNVLWVIMAAAGLVLLALEAVLAWPDTAAAWPYLAIAPVFVIAMYGFWYVGLIAGGADAKALMALAFLVPYPLLTGALASPFPGAFSVLGNSLLAFLLIPVALALGNLARGHVHVPAMFLGLKRPVARIGDGHYWPMERVVDGRRRIMLFPSRLSDGELDELRAHLAASGAGAVWVTPKVPFMIPMLIGFLLAFVAGDLLFGAIALVVDGLMA